MKKPVTQAILALRFYLSDGWTKEELDECCIKGETIVAHPKDAEPYLIADHTKGTKWNINKLVEKISEIKTIFEEHHTMSWNEMIKRDNW